MSRPLRLCKLKKTATKDTLKDVKGMLLKDYVGLGSDVPTTINNHKQFGNKMKVEELKKIVKKINDKNVHLEGKIKEIEEREVVKIKEAAKYIEHPRKVSNKVENSLDPKEKKSKPI